MSNSNSSSGGIGVVVLRGVLFVCLLGVLFVGLKLTGVINWSWWLVLLPFYSWEPIILVLMMTVIVVNLK